MEYGCNADNLGNYLALMDADRVKQIAKLKEAFDKLDQNKNGELSFEEVQTAFEQLGHNASHNRVVQWMKARDGNGDGGVTFQEFVNAYARLFNEEDAPGGTKIRMSHNGHVKLRYVTETGRMARIEIIPTRRERDTNVDTHATNKSTSPCHESAHAVFHPTNRNDESTTLPPHSTLFSAQAYPVCIRPPLGRVPVPPPRRSIAGTRRCAPRQRRAHVALPKPPRTVDAFPYAQRGRGRSEQSWAAVA